MGTREMGFFILSPTNKLGLTAMPSTSLGTNQRLAVTGVGFLCVGRW